MNDAKRKRLTEIATEITMMIDGETQDLKDLPDNIEMAERSKMVTAFALSIQHLKHAREAIQLARSVSHA